MKEIGIILAKYKNIAEIFSAEWFEEELKKPNNVMHLLAKQFTFEDALNNKISIHLFDHLEEYLGFLKEEIRHKGKIVRKLKNFKEFQSVYAEIEIASFFKKLGFKIDLDPSVFVSKKIPDLKISKGKKVAFFEVRSINEREGRLIEQRGSIRISTINWHPTNNIIEKIKDESIQLPNNNPGIVAFHLHPSIPITSRLKHSCYLAINQDSTFSGILLYHHFFNIDGCNEIIDLIINPRADHPLYSSFLKDFENGGIEISESPEL